MAQTVDAINLVDAVIHVSADGATWTDISGSTNKVEVSNQEADVGEVPTLEGLYMIGTAGKFKPVDISLTILYTETTGEAHELIKAQVAEPQSPLWVRWSPKGAYNTKRYTTANGAGTAAAGRITSVPNVGADASEAAAALLVFKVRATRILTGTVTPSASKSPSASASPSASLSPSASPS